MAMPFGGEPRDDQAVQQHGGWRGPLDCFPAPTLRLLETEMAFGLLERLFDRPPSGVPGQHLLGSRLRVGRVKRLRLPSASQRFDRDNSQRPIERAVPTGLTIAQPHTIAATVEIQFEPITPFTQHLPRRGQARTPFAWPAMVPGLRSGGGS